MLLNDPYILWTLVGVVAGMVLGVSGAGGGLIAIPMLIYLGGYGVKDATGYGLWCISMGSAFTWFIQRHNTNYKIVLILTLSAMLFAYLSAPIKLIAPPWVVITLLNITCIGSLYSLWMVKQKSHLPIKRGNPFIFRSAAGGAIAGFLSTMTGMGGGVVMIPWLLSVSHVRLAEAAASSLMVIALTAPFSIWAQGKMDMHFSYLVALAVGVILAAIMLRYIIRKLPESRVDIIRKSVLSLSILSAMIGTINKLNLW